MKTPRHFRGLVRALAASLAPLKPISMRRRHVWAPSPASAGPATKPRRDTRLVIRVLLLGGLLPLAGAWAAEPPLAGSSPGPETDLASLSLEELAQVNVATVQGASRYEQKISQAPASISIVTEDDIKKFGYRNLAEILNGVRGFYTPNDRNYTYLGMRGFSRPGDYNGRILAIADGHHLNENIFGSILAGNEEMLDVDLIERLEVIRGPSSSIYGNHAFFGVLNIITRSGEDIDGWETSAEGGSFETFKGRATYGKRYENGLDWVVSGSVLDSDGDDDLFYEEFDDPATNNGHAIDSDDERSYKFFSRANYGDVSVSGQYSHREKTIPTASFGTVFNEGGEETADDRAYVDVRYERAVGLDASLLGRVYYDWYGYQGDFPYTNSVPGAAPFIVVNQDESQGQWAGAEAQWTQVVLEDHKLVLGSEFRENFQQKQLNFDRTPRTSYLRDDRESWSVGGYGQAEAALRENLRLNAGVRYDYYSSFGSTVNPRAGLIYSPWAATAFKLLYGTAYREPNVFESYYEAATDFRANPGLDPETINTYEVVYEQELPALPGRHMLTVSAYYYEIEDLIAQSTDVNDPLDPTDDQQFFDNLDKVKAKGVEFEVEGRYEWGFRAQASYALQEAEDDQTGQVLSNSPRHLAKVHFVMPLYPEKLFAGVEVLYQGQVKTVNRDKADDIFLTNFTLYSQPVAERLELSASIYNLFDEHYSYPGSPDHVQSEIGQNGRTFRIKLTYTF